MISINAPETFEAQKSMLNHVGNQEMGQADVMLTSFHFDFLTFDHFHLSEVIVHHFSLKVSEM